MNRALKKNIKKILRILGLLEFLRKFYLKSPKVVLAKENFPRKLTLAANLTQGAGLTSNFVIRNPIEKFRIENWGGEKDFVESLISYLNEDDVFWDIGSSVGLVTVFAASKVKKGHVFAFEPDPENTSSLMGNLKANNCINVTIIKSAIGNMNGAIELFSQGSNAFSPSLKAVNGINRTISVPINTIDSLLKRNEIQAADVIKIDIEGAEMMALEGMSDFLTSNKRPRKIFLELHPMFLRDFQTSIHEIIAFLLDKGFRIDKIEGRDRQLLTEFSYSRNNG